MSHMFFYYYNRASRWIIWTWRLPFGLSQVQKSTVNGWSWCPGRTSRWTSSLASTVFCVLYLWGKCMYAIKIYSQNHKIEIPRLPLNLVIKWINKELDARPLMKIKYLYERRQKRGEQPLMVAVICIYFRAYLMIICRCLVWNEMWRWGDEWSSRCLFHGIIPAEYWKLSIILMDKPNILNVIQIVQLSSNTVYIVHCIN